ncbi:hypothetical protein Taro_025095 [Colocasia esculenta]|uniref:AT-hook motif nuclear-localized protein n=1 Tax=Colocasia esculenta TaxID=4460 RepID=A0A843VGI4_COLES|nr:hypothetical protein [Colocasia esculenta]
MEGRESLSSGVAAAAPAKEGGGVFPLVSVARAENPIQGGAGAASAPAAAPAAATSTGTGTATGTVTGTATISAAAAAAASAAAALALGGSPTPASMAVPVFKKKRGRPRKYAPDGSLVMPLSLMPISASVPHGEFSVSSAPAALMKRGRGRPGGSLHKHQPWGFQMDSFDESVACSAGANFTPHIITVAPGEDVTMKIISFSQQGPRGICILSANGAISNVTLRQPDSSGGTMTYEGRFELLSLSGSFMPTESGGTRSRSGGMSVSLASPDGRVVGGGVAGLLVAASPVQVVVGSFLPNYQMEQKTKKFRVQPASIPAPAPAIPISSAEMDDAFSLGQGQSGSNPRPNAGPPFFRGENWSSSLNSAPDSRNSPTDVNISLPGC